MLVGRLDLVDKAQQRSAREPRVICAGPLEAVENIVDGQRPAINGCLVLPFHIWLESEDVLSRRWLFPFLRQLRLDRVGLQVVTEQPLVEEAVSSGQGSETRCA